MVIKPLYLNLKPWENRKAMGITKSVKIGISSCLLGKKVRYDGRHKLDHFLADTLGRLVQFIPVCPELEAGFGVPRERMHLEGDPTTPRLVTSITGQDVTDTMTGWAAGRLRELERENLCGFIFKSKSPSSGMERVAIVNDKGMPARSGSGIFAGLFMKHFPLVPVEDEGRLHDPGIRENFIERVFTLRRWRDMMAAKPGRAELIAFHTTHKLLILSHSTVHYTQLGKIVAAVKSLPVSELFPYYQTFLTEALRLKATPAKHANVLEHMLGYFKKDLSPDEKQEMLDIITQYRKGLIPLIVPITLLSHYTRKYCQPYLSGQVYLNPHPVELQLRNHA
jgi:uncharacterized protein YbgA (DUF1722 family)/uncharacterized protein YbbK (DUF523 family)